MGGQKPEKTKKHICVGLLAHVDAGKTTLLEALLYLNGSDQKSWTSNIIWRCFFG